MQKRSSPSAHDVARVAGVSQAAVSRAFTPGASIAKATQEKVFRAAKSIGYRPNLLARSLIMGQSGIVGVVVGNVVDTLTAKALDQLSAKLAQAGKHILMFTAQEAVHADEQVEDLLKYRVDALLLMATSLSSTLAERCYEEKIPVIFFNRQFGKAKKFTSVVGNNRKGARKIAEHLMDQGYSRIAILGGLKNSATSRERESAFKNYLTKQGLPAPVVEIGDCHREGAVDAARRLLSRKQRPDAIFCANDFMALAAIEVARYDFGLDVGPDVGIAGFDDVEQASWPSFDLTTYSYPLEPMVEEVTQILLSNPSASEVIHKSFEGELKVRGSSRRKR